MVLFLAGKIPTSEMEKMKQQLFLKDRVSISSSMKSAQIFKMDLEIKYHGLFEAVSLTGAGWGGGGGGH